MYVEGIGAVLGQRRGLGRNGDLEWRFKACGVEIVVIYLCFQFCATNPTNLKQCCYYILSKMTSMQQGLIFEQTLKAARVKDLSLGTDVGMTITKATIQSLHDNTVATRQYSRYTTIQSLHSI